MKRIIKYLLCICFVFVFCNKVYAESYGISLTTNNKDTVETGDIIEISMGISYMVEDYSINEESFLIIYDENVLEPVYVTDQHGFSKASIEYRKGWETKSSGYAPGEAHFEIKSTSPEYDITVNDSTNADDNVDAVIATMKFKVISNVNQITKIQIVDKINYVKSLDFTIYNKSSNNFLSKLEVKNNELNKSFNKNDLNYEVYVPYDVEKVTVSAEVEDKKSSLNGIGEKQLTVGENKIKVEVVSESGEKKIYTINVIRKAANDDKSLSKLVVMNSNKEKVALSIDSENKIYEGTVSSDITFVTFDIVCSGEGCVVETPIAESLVEGKNEFSFSVFSQNGSEEVYKIIINKDFVEKDNTTLYLFIGLVVSVLINFVLLITRRKK